MKLSRRKLAMFAVVAIIAAVGGWILLRPSAMERKVDALFAEMRKYDEEPNWARRLAIRAGLAKPWDARHPGLIKDDVVRLGPDAAPYVRKYLRDPRLRCEAICALGDLKDHGSVPGLTELASDPDEIVSNYAIRALGDIGDARPLPTLLPLARAGRQYALIAVGQIGGEGVFEILAQAAVSDDNKRQDGAALGLGYLGDPRTQPYLVKLLESKHANIAASAARGLAKIGNAEALGPLRQAQGRAGPGSSDNITDAIASICKRCGVTTSTSAPASSDGEARSSEAMK